MTLSMGGLRRDQLLASAKGTYIVGQSFNVCRELVRH
jgi:hypothetical protein